MREFEQSTLVVGAGDLWPQATKAQFLSAIRDGNLPQEAFRRWLVQDYLFARGTMTFLAVTISKTPRPAQKVLITGLTALDLELDWFEENARKRGLDLNVAPHQTRTRYVDFLVASAYSQPFEVLLAILYGVEVSYLCAWSALARIIHQRRKKRLTEPGFTTKDAVTGCWELCSAEIGRWEVKNGVFGTQHSRRQLRNRVFGPSWAAKWGEVCPRRARRSLAQGMRS